MSHVTASYIESNTARLLAEIAELEQMVAAAPDEHPAKLATRRLRAFVEDGPSHDWWTFWGSSSARSMANRVASGQDEVLANSLT